MSFDHDWHVPPERMKRYAHGSSSATERDSIEAHLLACEQCRGSVATSVPRSSRESADATLRAVTDRIDRPRRPLHRSTGALQVSLASPALVAATAGLAVALFVAVAAASAVEPRWGVLALVAVAPLVPVAAAMAAFWPMADPAGALAASTPLAGGRLPFLRALFATSVTAAAGLLSSAFTSLGWLESVAWLAPGLALAAFVIAAATWTEPKRVAAGLALAWLVVCAVWARGLPPLDASAAADELASIAATVQTACVVVIVVAAIVALARRNALPNWRTA